MVHTHKKRLPIPDTCPEWYATLIRDCWDQDPDARPSFAEIIKRLKRGGPAPTVLNWIELIWIELNWIELNTLHFYEEFFHVLLFVVSRKLRNGLVCVGESKEKEAFSFKEWNKQARTSIATQSRAIGSWRNDVRLMFVHKTDKLGSNIYKITSNSSNELCTFLSLTLLNESGNIMFSSLGISKSSSITRKNELSRCTSQAK